MDMSIKRESIQTGTNICLGKHLNKVVFCLITMTAVLLSNCFAFMEGSFSLFDFSNDLEGYAEFVSTLNARMDSEINASQKDSEQPRNGSEISLVTVLCKTTGTDLQVVSEGLVYEVAGPRNCYTLYYTSQNDAEQAITVYLQDPCIVYAELDSDVSASSLSSEEDAYDFNSWGAYEMNFIDYIHFSKSWGNGQSVVAVIDSGVCQHPLISSKIIESGFDYIDVDEDSTNDIYGHGTHVAGIIADCTRDVPVYIYPIRVLNGAGGGKTSNVINAIMEASEKKVDIINLSVESRVMSDALDCAVLDAIDDGIVIVVAAGNSSCDTSEICPAHLRNSGVVVVGAAEIDGDTCERASYSNYGESVDLFAFGTDIVSCSRTGGYVKDTGTSMAAPHVSALCAMLRLVHAGLSPSSVEERAVAASGIGNGVFVPDTKSMVPDSEGILLNNLSLHINEEIQLPDKAIPISSCETIKYTIENPAVLTFNSGLLKACAAGTTAVNVSCVGFPDFSFTVDVDEFEDTGQLILPSSLSALDDEAYEGDVAVEQVILPDGLTTLGNGVFANCDNLRIVRIPSSVIDLGINTFSNAVIMCEESSAAHEYCKQNGIQHIATS